MATTTAITTGTTSRSSSDITVADGSSIVVYTDIKLNVGENVIAERTYDGGTNYTPVSSGVLCDDQKREGRFTGPGVIKLTVTDTDNAVVVYYDS